ncbi:facilitated trehalose transporter Tret1-like isoform X1 [Colletes gigas]|uniref:facilitated trehalose transporter Tret1-like isoform X1 n=1 Tax=Colletes gigas TaxID=935657 RepID=UPI001C9A757A|nr:facilitated trehalose transporter Tret1-like isoform X1 [Colletes gigas]
MANSQRRQMMQPWPLCLVHISKTKERSILPKYYTKVPTVTRSTPSSSGINLDCASNTTLLTNASPFNSQTALIAEKRAFPGSVGAAPASHYYEQNLRNNHQKALNGSRIYDPLEKDLDHDYKQIDPLLAGDQPPYSVTTKSNMSSQDSKPLKASSGGDRHKSSYEFQREPKPSLMRFATQVLAALSVSMGSMVVGYSSSFTSPGLVSMRDNATATFEVTKEIGMWIGSIMPLSALFGGIAGGPCIEYLGRRNTILATALPFIAAWLLIALATNVAMVLVGRALCGFCVGIASLSLPVYLGETIQAEVRGTLGLLPTAFGNTGILVCFVAGMYMNWRNLALLGASLPIPFMILMFMIPETPRWYISKGKTKRARKSLQWLRGKDTDITEELTAVEKLHIESERNVSQGAFMELFKKGHLKPLLISLGLMFFQQLSGINAVIFYTVQIFKDAGSSIDENLSTIFVGIVNFISTFVAAAVIDKLGRKMLLYISGVSMCLTLFTFGAFFYVKNVVEANVSEFGWIPLLSLVVYVIGFSLGFGPIPWLMMGEILPVKIRGSAASVATAFNWTCTFVVTKTYQDIVSVFGTHGTFWMFGVIVLVGFVFVIFCVPETRGRSLEEIEKRFAGPVRRMSAVANMKPMPMAC